MGATGCERPIVPLCLGIVELVLVGWEMAGLVEHEEVEDSPLFDIDPSCRASFPSVRASNNRTWSCPSNSCCCAVSRLLLVCFG